MKEIVILCLSFALCLAWSSAFSLEESAHTALQHRHMKYAKIKNPIPMNEQSIMRGKELYGKYCLRCHGEGGKAKGNLDLTKTVLIHGGSDGEIFHSITDDIEGTPMKGFKKELTDVMRWNLVNYVKSLRGSRKKEDR